MTRHCLNPSLHNLAVVASLTLICSNPCQGRRAARRELKADPGHARAGAVHPIRDQRTARHFRKFPVLSLKWIPLLSLIEFRLIRRDKAGLFR